MSSPTQNPITGLQRTPFLAGQLVGWQWMQFFLGLALAKNVATFLQDTHKNRLLIPAKNYASGTLFYETDRQVLYIAVSGTWFYFSGAMPIEQANLPLDLIASDLNFLAQVTDYSHLLAWTGTGWTWAPGENGSGYSVPFVTPPNPATGWQACDGSPNIPTLNFDGTLSFVTVPNVAGSFYRQ